MSETITVEFVGPPAVGKTTLSIAVADRLKARGYQCTEPARTIGTRKRLHRIAVKLRLVAYRFFRTPTASITHAHNIHHTNQQNYRDGPRVLFNWLCVCALHEQATGDIALFDQGVFQALWSIGFRSELDWEQSLRCITIPQTVLPDFVVIVRADESVLRERLDLDRASETRASDQSSDIRRSLKGIDHLETLLSEYKTELIDSGYMTVDNSDDQSLESTAAAISEQIHSFVDAEY